MSSLLEKDAGFCSGSSEHEDDHHSHDGLHSPTDTSEDSVEVKFTPIMKNKRKSSEPSRVVSSHDPEQGPLKKRFRYEESKLQAQSNNPNLHRPWALAAAAAAAAQNKANPADILVRHPGVTTLHRAIMEEQEEPLALVAKKSPSSQNNNSNNSNNTDSQKLMPTNNKSHHPHPHHNQLALNHHNGLLYSENSIESLIKKTQISLHQPNTALDVSNSVTQISTSSSSSSSSSLSLPQVPNATMSTSSSGSKSKASQRNYKNMTRERRIEANARERTRVHTISAAYDTLRQAVPSYSNTQKLSKLSVLRVACSYILTLSRLAGEDFSIDQSEPPIQDCIDSVTRTIQTEGKLRRKKDE
jgi:hypothetical protein